MPFDTDIMPSMPPAICPDLLRKQLVLRKIAPHVEEWWTYFLKDIQYRGFKSVDNDDTTCILDYGRRHRIQIEVKPTDTDLWIYPKLKNHPFFLKMVLLGLGAVFFIILGIAFFLIRIQPIFSFLLIPLIAIGIFVPIAIILQLFVSKRMNLYGISVTGPLFMEIYQAARYAENKILEQYYPSDYPIPIQQIFCPRCGKKMDNAWATCPFCGTHL